MAAAMNLFVSNPSLVGFESPGRMLFTSVKEIFENALDACRGLSKYQANSGQIDVHLRPATRRCAPPSSQYLVPLELIVRDNGGGMDEDPEILVQLFASTKGSTATPELPQLSFIPVHGKSADSTSGKFGVGLSASILHTHEIFGVDVDAYTGGGLCRITTRTMRILPKESTFSGGNKKNKACVESYGLSHSVPKEDKHAVGASETKSDLVQGTHPKDQLGMWECRCVFGVDRKAGIVVCVDRSEGFVVWNEMLGRGNACQDDDSNSDTTSDVCEVMHMHERRNGENRWKNTSNECWENCSQCGTEVRLIVPGGSSTGSASARLSAYFLRLNLVSDLLGCNVCYHEEGCQQEAWLVIQSTKRFDSPHLSTAAPLLGHARMADFVRFRGSDPSTRTSLKVGSGHDHGDGHQMRSPSRNMLLGQTPTLLELSSAHFASMSRVSADCRAIAAVACTTLVSSSRMPGKPPVVLIEFVRLANHVPLPDSPAAIACALCSSFTSIPFTRFLEAELGLRIKGPPHFDDARDGGVSLWVELTDLAPPPTSFAEAHDTSTISDIFADRCAIGDSSFRSGCGSGGYIGNGPMLTRPGCPLGLNGRLVLVAAVDLTSDDICFGSLDKSYLANHNEYREAAASALIDCFSLLKTKQPALFSVLVVDPRAGAFQAMLRTEIPSFADALASLIVESDEDRLRWSLDALSLPPTHMHQPTLAASLATRLGNIYFRGTSSDQESDDAKEVGDRGRKDDDRGEWTVLGRRRKQPKKTSSSVASASGGYNDYTSKELKDILRAKGQKLTGSKSALVARILELDGVDSHDQDKDQLLSVPRRLPRPAARVRGKSWKRTYESRAETLADEDHAANYGEEDGNSIDNDDNDSPAFNGGIGMPKVYHRLIFSDDESNDDDEGKISKSGGGGGGCSSSVAGTCHGDEAADSNEENIGSDQDNDAACFDAARSSVSP